MSSDKVQKAMDNISEFYFGEGEDSGEAMFKNFAQKHADTVSIISDHFSFPCVIYLIGVKSNQ